MKLIIPEVPISLNKMLRQHWAKRRLYYREWKWLIRSKFIGYPLSFLYPQTKKCIVIITQYRKRLLDKDNLLGSCKAVLDAIRYWGLIKDDSPKWIDLEVYQYIGKPVRTEIEIKEA